MARSSMSKKGSQLSQLKHSIKSHGLNKLSSSASSSSASSKNNKKLKSSITSQVKDPEFRQKKLAEIQAAQNLFDLKTSKVKFPVTSRQSTGTQHSNNLRRAPKNVKTVGRPTQSATQAHQRRVETLLPEYENRHKSSQFLDKRFGEGDSSLTPEEKALERFTKERQTRLGGGRKRNVFNLEDEGEGLYDDGQFGDSIQLTHAGRGLELDDDSLGRFGDGLDPEEDLLTLRKDRRGREGSEGASEPEGPVKKKSKAEVMSEIITKSKAHKYERQMMRDKDDELRFELNDEFKEIRSLLMDSQPSAPTSHSLNNRPHEEVERPSISLNSPKTHTTTIPEDTSAQDEKDCMQASPAKHPDVSSGVDRSLLAALIGSSSRASSVEPEVLEEDDAYDRFVRELAFDARAKPSDRLKTAEESALEEAERLKELERQRLRRMKGLISDDDEEEEDESGNHSKKKSDTKGKKKRKPEADDLDDDFYPDEEITDDRWGIGQGLRADGAFGAGVLGEHDDDGDATQSDSDAGSPSSEGDDGDDDSEVSGSEQDDHQQVQAQPLVSTAHSSHLKKRTPSGTSKTELAYTYACPSSHADFLSILSSTSAKASDLPTVVQRIRVLYHPSLDQENKEKLATFTNVLIDHIIYISSQPSAPDSESPWQAVQGLLPDLINLCQSYTQTSAGHFVSKLSLMEKNLKYALADPSRSGWPGPAELTLLRLVGLVWSTSDFSHPVVAPALLLICQYLNQLRVREFTDLMSGLFLCTVVLQYETYSKRLVPEVINFLTLALLCMTSTKLDPTLTSCMVPILEGTSAKTFGSPENKSLLGLRPRPLNFGAMLSGTTDPAGLTDQALVDGLDVVVSLLKNFSDLYSNLSFYTEVFLSVLAAVEATEGAQGMAEETQQRLAELASSVRTHVATAKRLRALNPLKLQAHRPVPVKSQTPQFESHYKPDQRPFNPDSGINEVQKLAKLVRKERKGAVREIRKDNRFLNAVKQVEREKIDGEYKHKIAKITAGLQLERSEEKKFERTKIRLKKLDKVRSGGGGRRVRK